VLQSALWVLGRSRYRALTALMLVVALGCIGAGTWQVSRYAQKVRDNEALVRNAHMATVPLSTSLVPLGHDGPVPGRDAIRFRPVTVSGSYLPGPPQFVRNQSQDGVNGYYVLAGLRTTAGVLLVVRGFVPGDDRTGAPPNTLPAPPAGVVNVAGRLQTPDASSDAAARLPRGELETINPDEQAARLGAPVYDGYVTLNAGQPGTAGLTALPSPDLSNPAGGAQEWQHLAYVVQWYLFALFALAAPFLLARREVRDARRQFLGHDPDLAELGEPADQPARPGGVGRDVALRERGTVAARGEPTPDQWERAAQLADRYDRSLGRGHEAASDVPAPNRPGRAVDRPVIGGPYQLPNSARTVQRVYGDGYHSSYNDYLWQLALADGAVPAGPPTGDAPTPQGSSHPDIPSPDRATPKIIEGTSTDRQDSADS
jgi:cytochrome oxidase assembly protein ShyY1